MFEKRINKNYLKLAQIVYGGEFYLELKNYKLKEVLFSNSNIEKVTDFILRKNNNYDFYSYKNETSGFAANLFEHINKKELVIAYRGTERFGLGENTSDLSTVIKDVTTDINIVTGNFDKQFRDAWLFYKAVKEQNTNKKITIVGQSLGGALAQIVAAKEYTVNRKKIPTFTFNAPGCSHLLDVYDCSLNLNYSFITNYSVMNDWCGMFGEHVGQRYLISPIPLPTINQEAKLESLNEILLSTHEGIFDYSEATMGKVHRKPKDFNQEEGLSLWYFDPNNPIQIYKNMANYIKSKAPQLNFQQPTAENNVLIQKAEKFFRENISSEMQNSNIAVALKAASDNIAKIQNELIEDISNNTFAVAIKVFDEAIADLTQESLKRANKILDKLIKK